MQFQRLVSFLLLVVVALCSSSNQVQAFEEPSESVRQALKTAIADEDVIAMQAEMAWGAQEMKRYKTLRGNWPTRSALASEEVPADSSSSGFPSSSEGSLFRGAGGRGEPAVASGDYWNYLVSMF